MDLQEALDTLDLCDICKIKLRIEIIEKELSERKRANGTLKKLEADFKKLIIQEKKEIQKKEVRLTYQELIKEYRRIGTPIYRSQQTKGFKQFLLTKGYPEYISNPEIKKIKQTYRDYKQTQVLIEQNQKEGVIRG